MKNKTNSGESKDRKKHKISAMRDTFKSLPPIFDSGDVTAPSLVLECNRVKLCDRKFLIAVQLKIMIFKLMLNFKPGDTSETIFSLVTQWHRRLRRKIRANCVIVKTKRRYQSDPIRSDPESDPKSYPGFVNGQLWYIPRFPNSLSLIITF